jgi:hypothetical protein
MTEQEEAVIEADAIVENAVGEMYRGFFRLRNLKEYQKEYDAMSVIIDMLAKDRQHLREKYGVTV